MNQYQQQITELIKELKYFNADINWTKFSAIYRKKHGYEFMMTILQWLKNDVKQTKQGTPLNELGKSAYPYLREIFENPYLEYIHQYIKQEELKDLDALGKMLNVNVDKITREVTPEWVVKARKRYKFLAWKQDRTPDENREIRRIVLRLKQFGYKLGE